MRRDLHWLLFATIENSCLLWTIEMVAKGYCYFVSLHYCWKRLVAATTFILPCCASWNACCHCQTLMRHFASFSALSAALLLFFWSRHRSLVARVTHTDWRYLLLLCSCRMFLSISYWQTLATYSADEMSAYFWDVVLILKPFLRIVCLKKKKRYSFPRLMFCCLLWIVGNCCTAHSTVYHLSEQRWWNFQVLSLCDTAQ